jgi:hypothetical protein
VRHVLRLGSVLLAAVLLGVPRALDARAFGAAPRSVYVDVSPLDPRLRDFTAELERAIDAASYRLVDDPRDATLIVEIHRVWIAEAGEGASTEAVSVTIRRGHQARPVVVHYLAGRRDDAARTLIRMLVRREEGT